MKSGPTVQLVISTSRILEVTINEITSRSAINLMISPFPSQRCNAVPLDRKPSAGSIYSDHKLRFPDGDSIATISNALRQERLELRQRMAPPS